MPTMTDLSKAVKERIISQKGIVSPPAKNRFIEDIMDVDIGDFNIQLEEFEEYNFLNMEPSHNTEEGFDIINEEQDLEDLGNNSNTHEKGEKRDSFGID